MQHLSRIPRLWDWSWENIYLSIRCSIVGRIVMCDNRSLMLEMGKRHLSNMIELHIEKKNDYILVYNAWWS